eukprot:c11134_g1_i1.p1 GENE.c11134_g1_i1~~c11134_g1_i1.p1  ORF type:complete len:114 (+),score=51.27 c11134_g1_i1:54-344(+)
MSLSSSTTSKLSQKDDTKSIPTTTNLSNEDKAKLLKDFEKELEIKRWDFIKEKFFDGLEVLEENFYISRIFECVIYVTLGIWFLGGLPWGTTEWRH